ncbi:hypothetical protein EV359DRAFT_68510 [Lentinula novae-zelandiae]|nr:hypothetical protein EV359DRAFT_68510 [Lentinula novae-zelandiae]
MPDPSSPSPSSESIPQPHSSPMSALRTLMSRRSAVWDRNTFKSDDLNIGNGTDIAAVVRDPGLMSMNPHSAMMDRAQSPAEHMAHVYLVVLENRDALRLLTLSQEYRIPETLKTTCKDYAWAYVLSPTILLYKSKSGPANVLAAMRQLNVSNLPPSSETGRVDVVLEVIKKGMTDAHHNVKEKITLSVKNSASLYRDIAALTQACIGCSKAKPMAALFVRIAFLRWQVAQHPTSNMDKFWDKVDEALNKYRTEFKTAIELNDAFSTIYEEDQRTYGEPDLVSHPQVAVRDLDQWLLIVHGVAGHSGASVPAVATPTIA